jgi:hypothetical protein
MQLIRIKILRNTININLRVHGHGITSMDRYKITEKACRIVIIFVYFHDAFVSKNFLLK